jgi:hypothetical protein
VQRINTVEKHLIENSKQRKEYQTAETKASPTMFAGRNI